MNTRQIDCMLELANTLNFKRAAENLFMSQSTLSYQIQQLEDEVGFRIFDRSGRGAVLTPAGTQFVATMRGISLEVRRAVETGQNFSSEYHSSIRVGLAARSALLALPQAISRMREECPGVQVAPVFHGGEGMPAFQRREVDILLGDSSARYAADIVAHPLYESHIYLVTRKDDSLARKTLVRAEDLRGRTLMVGGGSLPALRTVQQRVVVQAGVSRMNSNDHMTTLVNVASGLGVCLSPGILNDGSGEFAWTPFDCRETISVGLLVHADDARPEVARLVGILQEAYVPGSRFERLV